MLSAGPPQKTPPPQPPMAARLVSKRPPSTLQLAASTASPPPARADELLMNWVLATVVALYAYRPPPQLALAPLFSNSPSVTWAVPKASTPPPTKLEELPV